MNQPITTIAVRESNTLARESASFPEMLKMGDALVKTGFLPDHIKTGAQAAAIIMTGAELGMPPMRALRSLNMVKGKVVENADSQLARFKTDGGHSSFKHGRCTFVGCKAKKDKDGIGEHLDDEHACLYLKHPNGDEHTECWTREHSKMAGLGGNHDKFPRAMFRSRVITAGLKSIGWEGAVGNYDPDEVRSFSDVKVEQPAPLIERGPTDEQAAEIKAHLATLGIKRDRGTYLDAIVEGASSVEDYADIVAALRERVAGQEARQPGETVEVKPPETKAPPKPADKEPAMITDAQKTRLLNLCDEGGATKAEQRLKVVGAALGIEGLAAIGSLTSVQADEAIRRLSGAPFEDPRDDGDPSLGVDR